MMGYSKTFTLRIRILYYLKKQFYPKQIADKLGISKQLMNYHLRKLEQANLIRPKFRSSIKIYELTDSGLELLNKYYHKVRSKNFSPRVRPTHPQPKTARLHAFTIKLPILRQDPNKQFKWEKQTEINNWIKQYYFIDHFPINITIEKTTKHIIAYFHQKETERKQFLTDFLQTTMQGLLLLYNFLLKEAGIEIDILNAQVIAQHIANKEQEYNEATQDSTTVEVELQRQAKSILPTKEDIKAKAWIDRSYDDLEIETNDLLYEEKLILMPEKVAQIENKLNKVIYALTSLESIINSMNNIARILEQQSAFLQATSTTQTRILQEIAQILKTMNNNNRSTTT